MSDVKLIPLNFKQPSTPSPKSLNDIQHDWKLRFAGIMYICKDENADVNQYFSEYDHVEPYSEKKYYSKRPYSAVYTGIMKDYQNYLCVISDDNSSYEDYYVVAKRIKSELEDLEKYCPCILCTSPWINPVKYIYCPHCTKCIKAGKYFTNSTNIELARRNKHSCETGEKKKNKYNLVYIIPACIALISIFFLW